MLLGFLVVGRLLAAVGPSSPGQARTSGLLRALTGGGARYGPDPAPGASPGAPGAEGEQNRASLVLLGLALLECGEEGGRHVPFAHLLSPFKEEVIWTS